jgi:hypothetical protein
LPAPSAPARLEQLGSCGAHELAGKLESHRRRKVDRPATAVRSASVPTTRTHTSFSPMEIVALHVASANQLLATPGPTRRSDRPSCRRLWIGGPVLQIGQFVVFDKDWRSVLIHINILRHLISEMSGFCFHRSSGYLVSVPFHGPRFELTPISSAEPAPAAQAGHQRP